MKIRPINVLELILFIVLTTSLLLLRAHAHIPYLTPVVFISCMFLGLLYFPLRFYTLKLPGVSTVYTVGASLLFSVSLVQVMFVILKWPTTGIISKVIIGLYVAAALAGFCAYLFKKQKGQLMTFNKWLLVRFVVYFLFVLYTFLAYAPNHHHP
jgi:hypothetical protein